MKPLRNSLIAILTCAVFVSCEWVQDVFWDCDNLQNADLVVDNIEASFKSEEDEGQVYEIIGIVLNTLNGLKKCQEDKASEAKSNSYRQEIKYSADRSMSNSKVVDTAYLPVGSTRPGETTEVLDEVTFLVDGYYEVTGYVDARKEVMERRENNNENENR